MVIIVVNRLLLSQFCFGVALSQYVKTLSVLEEKSVHVFKSRFLRKNEFVC